jgi:ADP-ribose pyrophosphatase YjhB (NUDIX family)
VSVINRFNVRVYGLLMNEINQILVVHEQINDFKFTKFPGGGLEYVEGIIDCLIREFDEETGLDINVIEHFYTTDFFQSSAFKPNDQLISVYYKVAAKNDWRTVTLEDQVLNIGNRTELLRFEWVELHQLNLELMTFPIDKFVCNKLIDR